MRTMTADVVVIGGGSTGAGVVRDAAMRGFSAVLVDRSDLGQGTTGRFHGLLHSGGRYVVSDPTSARECAAENAVLGRIQAPAIERTGGFFVAVPGDDPDYGDRFLAGAAAAGVEANEISVAEALRREPRLNPGLFRAIEVQDASVDGWQLVWGAVNSAKAYGARVLTYHPVTRIDVSGGRARAVHCFDQRGGEEVVIECGFVLNCAGVWAGRITELTGLPPVPVVPGRGIMVAMNHRLVNTVVNRLIYPADGDILVPVHTVSVIGTTDSPEVEPDHLPIPAAEVQQMLDAGEQLIPGFRQARAVHAWAGSRPLIKDESVAGSDTRHMSRGMSVIDHSTRDGVQGLLTIAGGKLTTYRLMAEHIVDDMCAQLGEARTCRTADEPMEYASGQHYYTVTHRLADREADRLADPVICECELLSRGMFTELLAEQPEGTLDDLRRQLRLGMGPCQGGFCASRAAGLTVSEGAADAERASGLLRLFLKNRWIGLWPILFGPQVRQTALDSWIYSGTLDIEHLPQPDEEVVR